MAPAQQHFELALALAQQDDARGIHRADEAGGQSSAFQDSSGQGGVVSVAGSVAEALDIGSASAMARA